MLFTFFLTSWSSRTGIWLRFWSLDGTVTKVRLLPTMSAAFIAILSKELMSVSSWG